MSKFEIDINSINTAADILQYECHQAAKSAGWWIDPKTGASITDNPYCFSSKLCLVHSEISEAMEGDRKDLMDDKLPHRKMREVELADAVIESLTWLARTRWTWQEPSQRRCFTTRAGLITRLRTVRSLAGSRTDHDHQDTSV